MILNEYRTWENFGGGKFWRIWRTVGNSPKFSPPIFINARVFNILPTDSPNFSLPKTLEQLVCQNFPPPKFFHARYIFERLFVQYIFKSNEAELWYRSIITSLLHASPRVSPRAVRVESAKSYRGKLRFHMTGRGFSTRRLVTFHETWHFRETTRGISTKRVVEFPRDQLPWNLAWNFHETSSRGA